MDPNATWKRYLDAVSTGDLGEAAAALADLCDWLRTGGCKPANLERFKGDGPALARILSNASLVLSWTEYDLESR